ncbi:hypothetical protein V6N11_031708 [Hibiscus sabdariffa]|uniref:Uncharacterized protein n=1 Tax=Hibiscus sabdariffa TaxID=183260 RepID=A0ABR2SYG9_9ROSI
MALKSLRYVGSIGGVKLSFVPWENWRYQVHAQVDKVISICSVVWNIWLTRNAVIFNSCCKLEGSILARSHRLVALSKSALTATSSARATANLPYTNQSHNMEEGWIRIYSDGARCLSNGYGSCRWVRNWIVRLNHIPRNLNNLPDSLVKISTVDSLDLIVFDDPLRSVLHILDVEAIS